MRKPISARRFLWVWAKRQLHIKLNTFSYIFSSKKKKKKEKKRSGTHSKRKNSFILQGLMFVLYFFIAFNMSWQTLVKLNTTITGDHPFGTDKDPLQLSYFAYSHFEDLEEEAKTGKQDTSLKEKRRQLLFEPRESTSHGMNDGKVQIKTFKNRYDKIFHELRDGITHKKKYKIKEAEALIKHFIANGTSTFTRDKSHFSADFSGNKSGEFLKWIGLYFLIALLALSVLEGIGSKNPLMQAPEDELDHLAQFPIKVGVLFSLPLIHRACFNVIALMFSYPPAFACFKALGYSIVESLLLALPVTFLFCISLASLQICYQFLGRYSSRKLIRVLCSYGQLPGYAFFLLLLMSPQINSVLEVLRVFALEDPGKLIPPALFISSIVKGNYSLLIVSALIGAVFPAVAIGFITAYSKGGLPTVPLESGSRNKPVKSSNIPHCGLRLLRDRNYFFQTVVSPIMLFAFYMIMYMDKLSGIKGTMALAMLAGAVSFVILGSLINLAAHEGPSLWMIFSGSRPVCESLKRTINFWMYGSTVFFIIGAAVIFIMPIKDTSIIKTIALLPGIPCMCYIAAAFSFSAYPPYNGSPTPPKPKVSIIYLFMFISSMFIQAVLFGMPGAEFTTPVLFGLLAFAIWQDSKRRIEYYLDPDYEADPELTVKNSMLWCMCFFWIQSLVFMIITISTGAPVTSLSVTISYGGAALFTVIAANSWYKKRQMHSVPEPESGRLSTGRGFLAVLIFGLLMIGFAWIYTIGLKAMFPDLNMPKMSWNDKIWFFLLAAILAPLLEEYLFRRLLQVSLLRTLKPRTALLFGALIFAAVHPLTSFPPVFCLGLGCGWIYWRSGNIWLAVCLHSLYNAGVVLIS